MTERTTESVAAHFVEEARAFLRDEYLPKIERCLDVLDEGDVWWRADATSNSVGNLLLHLDGSTRTWVLGVAGGRPVTRDREGEFAERGPVPKAVLLDRLQATLAEVDAVLAGLDVAELLERRHSPWEDVTVLWAVLHAVEHFAMHTGQIILLTKLRTRRELRLST